MNSCTLTSVLLLLFCFSVHAAPFSGCLLDTDKNLPKKNEPLFLIKDEGKSYSFILPRTKGKDGYIELKNGQEIIMSCPGENNYMVGTKKKLNNAYCKSGDKLTIKQNEFASESLDCHERVVARINKTDEKCHSGKGTVLVIGFKTEGVWYPLVTVCHDIQHSHTFYSTHTLHGAALLGKVHRTTGRPAFSRGEKFLFKGFKPERTYNRNNQEKVFDTLLGKKRTTEYLDSKTKFLARGHLAPDADFIFSTWQYATYFYINVAPQWQTINAGNWLQVEANSRRIASKLRADVEVATGTNGVSKLWNSKGKEKEIYLEPKKKVPVPEYYWKLLRYPVNDSCMGFIATNNPYLKQEPKHKCKDICNDFGWPKLQNDLMKGYVYCCDYGSIKKVIPEIPDFKCKNTLYFA